MFRSATIPAAGLAAALISLALATSVAAAPAASASTVSGTAPGGVPTVRSHDAPSCWQNFYWMARPVFCLEGGHHGKPTSAPRAK
jgi:hypothetical protein